MEHRCPKGTHRVAEYGCYINHGCRCDGCVSSRRQYKNRRRTRIRQELHKVRAERAPLKALPPAEYVTVPLLDLPWYQDRKVGS